MSDVLERAREIMINGLDAISVTDYELSSTCEIVNPIIDALDAAGLLRQENHFNQPAPPEK